MQRQLYGASSERHPRDKDGSASSAPPEPPSGPRAQRDLALEEHIHQLGPDERCCETCGREMLEWQGQDEQTEEVDVVQRLFVLRRDVRRKYRCQCGAAPKRAPGSYPEASEALDLTGEMSLLERDLPDWQAITDPRIREPREANTRPMRVGLTITMTWRRV